MKVAVVGEGHLADTTFEACSHWFAMSTVQEADVVWFCVDTPVNQDDASDVESVFGRLSETLRQTPPTTPVLISSQLPVGSCAIMESRFPEHHLVVQPENIRKATARGDFWCQNRIIAGTRYAEDHELIYGVLSRFCPDPNGILFMSPESAEMVKHALNGFLALEITYANEIADICEQVGADTDDVFHGFRSDRRVGNGPLQPGGPYTGGTLGRDVVVLASHNAGPVISAIKPSNDGRL